MTGAQVQQASLDEIKQALESNAFEFFYQPKVSFASGRITGGEALIRWRKADGGLIPPVCFIPVAEKSGFISEITLRMLPKLLSDYTRVSEVAKATHVAFNVSALDLEQERLVLTIEEAIDRGQIPAHSLRIEVTEAAALGSSPAVRTWAERLVRRGVALAMDDFGTGYATLDAVRKLPFSTLKIDQSIVREMEASERSAELVHANVSLAQILGMDTVAEGIETETIYETLMHSGCREGQGYWMSKPLPLPDYIKLLSSPPVWPASHGGPLRTALMSHVIELRRAMDWAYSSQRSVSQSQSAVGSSQRLRFSEWVEGDGQALHGNRTFEGMRTASAILGESYSTLRTKAAAGASPSELAPLIAKVSHYSVVLIGDLLRLESELLLAEMQQRHSTAR